MNLIRLVFKMTWLMEILNIQQRRTAPDKILRDKAFNTAKNPKYDGYQRGLTSMVYKFFDKKSASLTDNSVAGSGVANEPNHQLATELHKPIIRKF